MIQTVLPSVGSAIWTDRLRTTIACILSILQLISQEPHHAGSI